MQIYSEYVHIIFEIRIPKSKILPFSRDKIITNLIYFKLIKKSIGVISVHIFMSQLF